MCLACTAEVHLSHPERGEKNICIMVGKLVKKDGRKFLMRTQDVKYNNNALLYLPYMLLCSLDPHKSFG